MSIIHTIRTKFISRVLGRDYVELEGSVIPLPDHRWCGPEFKDDAFYLRSAEGEAQRLMEHLGCGAGSRVLDVGCGQGRVAIGLKRRVPGLGGYVGIDIDRRSVEWCQRHIGQDSPAYRFLHLDLYNERYNQGGAAIGQGFQFDLPEASADIAYLFSVFSHTTEADMRPYLRDFRRVLGAGGRLFFTTFVEEGVPDVSINPEGYRLRCSGPLHVVRYSKPYLLTLLAEHGYELLRFTHATEADGQSALYLRALS